MEAQSPFNQIPPQPDGKVRIWMSVFVPVEEGQIEFTTVSDIDPPLTHKRLKLAARRMANVIMSNMLGPQPPMPPAGSDTLNGNGGDAA